MAKRSHLKLAKGFHIYKWIYFAISTFVIIEEMASACAGLLEVKCHVEKSWSSYTQLGMGFTV